jgi:hypothetical protein
MTRPSTANCYGVLIRHFFGRFFDRESLSEQSEAESNVVQALAILAVPGAFFALLVQPLTFRAWGLVSVRYFFVSFSMIVMGFIMVFKWDALFPDRRDYQILTPLPVRPRTLFVTKVLALGLFLGLFLVDMNLFGTLFWPGIDGGNDFLRIFGAHIAAVAAAGLFTALAAAAIQGALITVLSGKLYRRVSVAVQTVLMSALVTMLFLSPLLADGAHQLIRNGNPVVYYFPGFWFTGLYELLRPAVGDPALLRLGHLAIEALAWAAGLFVLTYLPGYRRHARKILEMSQPSAAGPGIVQRSIGRFFDVHLLKRPVERAVFHFISQTITRSAGHRLFLATYGGFGAALAVASLPAGRFGLLRTELMLSFILVSGLRAAFNVPAELRGNWVFRISEGADVAEYLAAARKWIVACGIVPLFLVAAPFELALFRWTTAVFHLAYGVTLSVLLTEILFFGFRKVPFTCAYFPGKINLIGLSVIYVFGFTAYSDTMSGVASWLVTSPAAALLFFAAAATALRLLAGRREWPADRETPLDYEDPGDPVVRSLGITSR